MAEKKFPDNLPGGGRFNAAYFLIAVFAVLLIQDFYNQATRIAEIPYSDFQNHLEQGRVEEIVISGEKVRGSLREPKEGEKKRFITNMVNPDLTDKLEKYNIKYSREIQSTFFRDLLSWVLPILIFFGIWAFLLKKMAQKGGMGGGFMNVGKSKAKIYVESDTKVNFEDVAGVDEAKHELQEVVEFLKDREKYSRLGGRIPKGVLLVGPPGTGKTLLAKAIAGEAGVTFFSISGSEFVEMFVGVGAARVRDLFEQARERAPSIIFIDELDALGKSRNAGGQMGGHDEKEQTLNQLLSELDGFDSKEGIILLGATNRPEILDPALLRAGRFDRQVLIDRPDKKGRIQILKVHAKNVKIDPNLEYEQIAALTTGFTGADLSNLVNEAALTATRREKEQVTMEDFTSAIERIVAGLERKNRLLNEFERKVVAHHELGHAMVAAALPGVDKVHKVSIVPRGVGALGYTIQRPTEDRYLMRKEELENKMATLFGGRVAERLIFQHLSTGASDDLSKATDIARSMIMSYGMDKELGNVTYERERQSFLGQNMSGPKEYSEETAREIDEAVRTLTQKAYDRAYEILSKNVELLKESAQDLLEKETFEQDDLLKIFERMEGREVPLEDLKKMTEAAEKKGKMRNSESHSLDEESSQE